MNLIDLALEKDLQPKWASANDGGEYHCACPECGGDDRFHIWPNRERPGYWCRQCERTGGSIKFCMEFLGLKHQDACAKLNIQSNQWSAPKVFYSDVFCPKDSPVPSDKWKDTAAKFIKYANSRALESQEAIELYKKRGLDIEDIKRSSLGWYDKKKFDYDHFRWDIHDRDKIWLPKGLVIPSFFNNEITRVKIRRADWHSEDKLPKYAEIPGSRNSPSVFSYGENKPIMIVEAELDAILSAKMAGDLCTFISVGTKDPDVFADKILRASPLLLFSLDFDHAGKKRFIFWRKNYSSWAWPVPKGKSPGDAFNEGVDLREWVVAGLKRYNPQS